MTDMATPRRTPLGAAPRGPGTARADCAPRTLTRLVAICSTAAFACRDPAGDGLEIVQES